MSSYEDFVDERALFRMFHYHPPAELVDRLPHLFAAIFRRLGPRPDLIELVSNLRDA